MNFYKIQGGAILNVIYANRNLILIRLYDLYDEEMLYPIYNTPKRFLLVIYGRQKMNVHV